MQDEQALESGTDAITKRHWHEAISLLQTVGSDSPSYCRAQGNLAIAALELGDALTACRAASNSLIAAANGGTNVATPIELARFARARAESFSDLNRWHEAELAFQHAEHIYLGLQSHFPTLRVVLENSLAELEISWAALTLRQDKYSLSVDHLQRARATAHKNDIKDANFWASLFVNLIVALYYSGKKLEATLAYQEGTVYAKAAGYSDLTNTITINAIEVGAFPGSYQEAIIELDAAARQVEKTNAQECFLRHCIACNFAIRNDDLAQAEKSAQAASEFLELQNEGSVTRAKYFLLRANLAEKMGHHDEMGANLDASAQVWLDRIVSSSEGLQGEARASHDTFRRYSRYLLDKGDYLRALGVFEIGRSIALNATQTGIATKWLPGLNIQEQCDQLVNQLQSELNDTEALVIMAVLPPEVISFIITSDGIQVIREPIPEPIEKNREFFAAIGHTSSQLPILGMSAVPIGIVALATKIAQAIAGKTIKGLVPYGSLHSVPWRVLLQEVGLDANQTEFAIGFTGVLLARSYRWNMPSKSSGLGFGSAAGVDFEDEVREFIGLFSSSSQLPLTDRNIHGELSKIDNDVVLISSHGEMVLQAGLVPVFHFIGMGARYYSGAECIPEKVNAKIVVLANCGSGIYEMEWGDNPLGIAPLLLRKGARFVVATRNQVNSKMMNQFLLGFGRALAKGYTPEKAFSSITATLQGSYDKWTEVSSLELISFSPSK